MASLAGVFFDVGAGELATPDDVVAGVDGDFYFKAIRLGVVFDDGGAFPLVLGAAVVFGYQEGAG